MSTIIIFPQKNEPPKCPSCGKEEKRVEICGHCNHVYDEESTGCLQYIVLGLIAIFAAWVILTLLVWFEGGDTLVSVIKGQIDWITSLRVY